MMVFLSGTGRECTQSKRCNGKMLPQSTTTTRIMFPQTERSYGKNYEWRGVVALREFILPDFFVLFKLHFFMSLSWWQVFKHSRDLTLFPLAARVEISLLLGLHEATWEHMVNAQPTFYLRFSDSLLIVLLKRLDRTPHTPTCCYGFVKTFNGRKIGLWLRVGYISFLNYEFQARICLPTKVSCPGMHDNTFKWWYSD